IFEPRYRQLLADCLATDRRFGVAYVPAERDAGGEPVPRPGDVGCVALIRNTQGLPDGRSNILTVGERRFVLIDWVSSERPDRPAAVVVPGGGGARARPRSEARAAGAAQHDGAVAATRRPRRAPRGGRRAPGRRAAASQGKRARWPSSPDRVGHVMTAQLAD